MPSIFQLLLAMGNLQVDVIATLVICMSNTTWLSEVISEEKSFPNLGPAYEMPVRGQIRCC